MTGKSRTSRGIMAIVAADVPLLSTAAPAHATTGFYVGAGDGNRVSSRVFRGKPALRTHPPATDHVGPNLVALHGVPGGPFGMYRSRSSAKAGGVFAIGHLPLLPRWLDICGKLGNAELWTGQRCGENDSNGYTSHGPLGIVSVATSTSETAFGPGGGVQTHSGAFTIQPENKGLSFSATYPSLLTLVLTWTF
jgi:hypothetical protein